MSTNARLRSLSSAIRTIGKGTGREVCVNIDMDAAVLLQHHIRSSQLILLIHGFENSLYQGLKTQLKARRGDFIIDRGHRSAEEQPFYFSGYWTTGKQSRRRFVFEIASSKALRKAAGLSGGGPRRSDYSTWSNQDLLERPWEEKQAIIDRAIGSNWQSLKAAIRPKAFDFGDTILDLCQTLKKQQNTRVFLKQLLLEVQPDHLTNNSNQQQFFIWCFLAYLHQHQVLLLPLHSYSVQLFSKTTHQHFYHHIIFSAFQIDAFNTLWALTDHYKKHSRLRMMRIVQTVFLASDIHCIGDMSPDAFLAICDGVVGGHSVSPTYRSKLLALARSAYHFLIDDWNSRNPHQHISQPVGAGFQQVAQRRQASNKATLTRSQRRTDPFWFADVADDTWHQGHPLKGYQPKPVVQHWAAMLREVFPHLKVKDPSRYRAAGVYWLHYINTLQNPPQSIEEISRSRHIHHFLQHSEPTFRVFLNKQSLSPGVKNDALSSLSQMFEIYRHLHSLAINNPIDYRFDRFLSPQVRGKTPRTPLSPELIQFLKDFNRQDGFGFSRSLKPRSWRTDRMGFMRHYRRVIDPEDGELKLMWWPGFAVLLDVMLTIPLRGFQARWLDTGEGDECSLDVQTLQEHPNPLPTAQKGRQMGVFKSFAKGLDTSERILGLWITTNKRTIDCDGQFGIPWCPDDLRDNIGMLITWQQRYNPISHPVRAERDYWVTQLRSDEVTAMIPEVYPLFRDPGSDNGSLPPTYQQLQTYWNLFCIAAEEALHTHHDTPFRLTRDRLRYVKGKEHAERVALFDLHTLRVSGITALIEAGLPPHLVQDIVGHATLVMTLYYHKIHPGQINRALTDALESRELSLERIPEILRDLDAYDSFLINTRAAEDAIGREILPSALGNGTYQVLSHGICPGGDCRTGGEYAASLKDHQPVPRAGACSLCRYRLTGPMFLAGLVINANKIMAELHAKGQAIARLNDHIRTRRREGQTVIAFESRRELLYRELENLWQEWAAEHHYVKTCANLLSNYLQQCADSEKTLPLLAADTDLAQLAVKTEQRHPFHLNQLLAQASAFIPSEQHEQAIAERDAFLNELFVNNNMDAFLLRLDRETRLYTGNLFGKMLAEIVPDLDLQALHDGLLPMSAFAGLEHTILELAAINSTLKDASDKQVSESITRLPGVRS